MNKRLVSRFGSARAVAWDSRLTWLPLGCVYLAWGGTFPAYRILLRGLPPLPAMGVRCLLCSVALYAWLVARHGRRALATTVPQLGGAAFSGLTVLGAIALTSVLEIRITADTAAVTIGSVPLWVIVLRAAHGERPARLVWLGVIIGFGGTILVVSQGLDSSPPLWLACMLAAAALEAIGTFYAARLPRSPLRLLNTAHQLMIAGLVFVGVSAVSGEWRQLNPEEITPAVLGAFAYLTIVATLLAYTAFAWLAAERPPSLVATYAYVNPIVALVVSWPLLGETLEPVALIGAALTILSVAAVVGLETRTAPGKEAAPPAVRAAADGAADLHSPGSGALLGEGISPPN